MHVRDKLNMDMEGLIQNGPITIVAFGDSVTHGALRANNNYETVYWNVLKQKLNAVRDFIPVNVINAGIGGITAKASLARMERDVLSHHPDLVIVCFALNDVNGTLEDYKEAMTEIFRACLDRGADVIFLTPNMMNTYLADDVPEEFREYAKLTEDYQNSGKMDVFVAAGIEIAQQMHVTVCDCYKEWKKLYAEGVDTTKLLINRLNHPSPEMHRLFADKLFDCIMGTNTFEANKPSSTMYQGK